MKIYESRLTWIIGYGIVTILFLYNFIVLPLGFMWFIKSLICFGCGGYIFWTKLFKEYPTTQRKPRRNLNLRSILKNERENIWNNRNDIWDNRRTDIWNSKNPPPSGAVWSDREGINNE